MDFQSAFSPWRLLTIRIWFQSLIVATVSKTVTAWTNIACLAKWFHPFIILTYQDELNLVSQQKISCYTKWKQRRQETGWIGKIESRLSLPPSLLRVTHGDNCKSHFHVCHNYHPCNACDVTMLPYNVTLQCDVTMWCHNKKLMLQVFAKFCIITSLY